MNDITTPGAMSGNGFIKQDGAKYQFAFRVMERPATGEKNHFRLDINYDAKTKKDDAFVATAITFIAFSDDPTYRPGRPPRPNIDTVVFSGVGDWNDHAGYRFEVHAADEGEPGRLRESVTIVITSPTGAVVATVSGTLSGGNVQSKRVKH